MLESIYIYMGDFDELEGRVEHREEWAQPPTPPPFVQLARTNAGGTTILTVRCLIHSTGKHQGKRQTAPRDRYWLLEL